MTLEQLQAMSDEELNELAAVKVMGWSIHELPGVTIYEDGHGDPTVSKDDWNPTKDMNDVLVLESALSPEQFHTYTVELMKMTDGFGHITYRDVSAVLRLTAKKRTIAAILAKLSEKGEGK